MCVYIYLWLHSLCRLFFYWSIVDLQCVSFRCTAKWFRYIYMYVKVLVAQLCPTLCDSIDCSLWGSSVHGILPARILEWVTIAFSRGSSWPRKIKPTSPVSPACRWILYCWATGEAHICVYIYKTCSFRFFSLVGYYKNWI